MKTQQLFVKLACSTIVTGELGARWPGRDGVEIADKKGMKGQMADRNVACTYILFLIQWLETNLSSVVHITYPFTAKTSQLRSINNE